MHAVLRTQIAAGFASVRRSWKPMLAVQAATLTIGLTYLASAEFRAALVGVSEFKQATGIWFAVVAGFFAGSFIPELAEAAVRHDPWKGPWLWNGLVFAALGALVDLFYWLQTVWFGSDTDWKTLLIKTVADMGVASILVFVPFVAGALAVPKSGWKARAFFRPYTPAGYRDLVLPIIVPNWCFWTPVVLVVYALPLPLQFPFSWLAEASWSIALVALSEDTVKQ